MKLTINTEALLNILLPLQPIINDNHMIPVLQNVKLEFTKKELLATGNNLEVSCCNRMSLKSDSKDSFCVNYTMLLAIVKSINDKELTLDISKKNLDIIHKKGNLDLPIEPSKEFPVTEEEKFTKKAQVKGTAFRSALKVANKFILNEDLDAMSNISLSIGKKIFVRSTDRHRMFEEKIKGSGDEESILISGKASISLFSLLEKMEEDIEMKYNKNSIFFKFDNKEIIVVQQQGQFPLVMFKKIINTVNTSEQIKLNVKDFVTALKRVSIMSSKEKYSTVKLEINKKDTIVSCQSEIASTKAEETIDSKFSEKRIIGYNYKYLIEVLSIFEKEPELYLDSNSFLFIKHKKKIGALAGIKLKD